MGRLFQIFLLPWEVSLSSNRWVKRSKLDVAAARQLWGRTCKVLEMLTIWLGELQVVKGQHDAKRQSFKKRKSVGNRYTMA
jgi:hypothetical protein